MEKRLQKENLHHLLQLNREFMSKIRMQSMFLDNPNRFKDFSIKHGDILFDYSKNRINQETMDLLLQLAEVSEVEKKRDAMFSGERINFTEDRAVLHTALRSKEKASLIIDGEDIRPLITHELEHMTEFSDKVRNGEFKGINGDKITDVVNIGIGGSYLGPDMVCNALSAYSERSIKMHFVSNVDGSDLAETLIHLDADKTLFIIASKTFTTKETLMNAKSAKAWFTKETEQSDISKNFVALSTNTEAVTKFGIAEENMFKFWDWVGGRYSVWSSIGLPIAISTGMDNFYSFLDGAYNIDNHFQKTKMDKNMPVIMALLGYWYNNFWDMQAHAVLPYAQYLSKFPSYLQQLDMESNGKRIMSDGHRTRHSTGPVIFGEAGTNGQHSFYQLLHQGTKIIPADFIAFKQNLRGNSNHHTTLLSNFIAQTEALMVGKTRNTILKELKQQGKHGTEIERVANYKIFEGNRPTNSFLIEKLSPYSLGELIALYEHKVFVQGIIWDVNSFDQMGVELGKVLATQIESELAEKNIDETIHDSSTVALMEEII
jgi:glucose-6-phosphate isomerase